MFYRGLILMIVSILAFNGCKETPRVLELPYDQMCEGDLVFRCGLGVFSRAVTAVEMEGRYSHIGILFHRDGGWKVVHAVPGEKDFPGDCDRVKEESVESFFSASRACRGCLVHTGLKDKQKQHIIYESALSFVRDSIRFDDKYDLQDTAKVYCAEFVWLLYKRANIDLSEGRRRYVKAFNIHSDCLLPEHLLAYKGNEVYYNF